MITFPFGIALEKLQQGKKVARLGWNGKDMFIYLVSGSQFKVTKPPLSNFYPEGTEITYQPHIDMKAANGTIFSWTAAMPDLLESDWVEVE